MLYVYVVRDGQALMQDGGFPEVNRQGPGEDTTRLVQSPGAYYLEVMAANADWSVSLEELR